MKRKYVISLISVVILVLLVVSLAFASYFEILFKLKPDLRAIDKTALEVHFIDVGQGDAIAIRFPNEQTLLVDSGPVSGAKKIENYLDKVFFSDNYNAFDYVFLTHSDADHSGNMEFILNNYTVKNFFRPEIYSKTLESDKDGYKVNNKCYDGVVKTLKDNDVPIFYYSDGNIIEVGDATIKILYSSIVPSSPNDFSPMLVVESLGSVVVLSGDMGTAQEQDIITNHEMPDADLYKLAHHGSKYSNSQELLSAITPEYVVACVGNNNYGHPSSDTLLRLAKYDEEFNKNTYSTFLNTRDDGNIIYYKNLSNSLSVLTIENVDGYLWVEYYVVVVTASVVLIGFVVVTWFPKLKIKKKKNIKH